MQFKIGGAYSEFKAKGADKMNHDLVSRIAEIAGAMKRTLKRYERPRGGIDRETYWNLTAYHCEQFEDAMNQWTGYERPDEMKEMILRML